MKRKHLKETLLMLLIIIPFIGVYGCGDGGEGGVTERTIALAYDTDKDGTPDVFDDYPDDVNRSGYPACDEADYLTTHDSMETAIGKDTPSYAPTTFKGSIDSSNSPDYFAVYLEAGKTYSLVFYDPQKLDGRAVTFAPNVTIYTGNVSYETVLPDPVDDPLQVPISIISDYEELPLEFSLVGDSHVIILSFTPQESRVHYIAVKSDEVLEEGESYEYRFDLIEDDDKDGMRIQFVAADGGNYIYNQEDILLLKSSMIAYVNEWASDGSPMTFSDGAQTAFAETVNYLAADRAEPVCYDQTSLNAFVSDIPWNSSYGFGYGIDATTGWTTERLQAVTSFTPPLPDNPSTKTDTILYFINTDEQYEREIQAGFNTTFSSFGVTFNAEAEYLDNIKYSEKETTLILKYYVKETEYRRFNPIDYTLTEYAKNCLEGVTPNCDFRKTYGDYFIAGARYGAQYIASLHIKATSSEKIKDIMTKIQQASSLYKFDATEKFKAKFYQAIAGSTVEARRTTIGGDNSKLSGGTITPEQMFDDLNTFIHSCTKDNRAPLEAYMFRFNQMPDGHSIASEINVNSCVFRETKDLSKNYLALSKRAEVIKGLDIDTFQPGVQKDYVDEYDTLKNEINDNSQAIFRDVNQIKAYGAEVEAALNKFNGLIDRQSFFLKLVALQKSWKAQYGCKWGHKDREMGFKNYKLSTIVNDDISKDYYQRHYEKAHVGWRTWDVNWRPGSNSIVCYIRINVDKDTLGDDCEDKNCPSLGRDHLHFYFESGYDRRGSWWLWAKGVYLGENGKSLTGNYPFEWDLML